MALTGDEPNLELGDTGEGVVLLQVRLYGLQIFREIPDGAFGMSTENAVRELQSQLGLDNSGEVNRETWEALFHQEQQVGINYQYLSPYDALDQLRYDLQHGGQRDGWGNQFPDDQSHGGELSEDGQFRWDGYNWQPVGGDGPSGAGDQGYAGQLSEDGQYRWDGSDWQPVSGAGGSGQGDSHVGELSEDGQYRWDGSAWQPVSGAAGPGSAAGGGAGGQDFVGQLSDDGQWRWDGTQWQAA
jgi:hypothetical protein